MCPVDVLACVCRFRLAAGASVFVYSWLGWRFARRTHDARLSCCASSLLHDIILVFSPSAIHRRRDSSVVMCGEIMRKNPTCSGHL